MTNHPFVMINMTFSLSSVQMKISFYFGCPSSEPFFCVSLVICALDWVLQHLWKVITRCALSTFCKPDFSEALFHQHLEDWYFICNNLLEDCLRVFNITWLLMVCITWSLLYFVLYFNAVNIFCIQELFCFCKALLAYCI